MCRTPSMYFLRTRAGHLLVAFQILKILIIYNDIFILLFIARKRGGLT